MKLGLVPAMGVFDRAVDALLGLPDSAGKIAGFFEDIGVTGYTGSGSNCPLAVYLQDASGPDQRSDVRITGKELLVEVRPVKLGYVLPVPAREFVVRFDFGEYPTLQRQRLYAAPA